MRRGLVVAQIALSLVLLTSGGLVIRSFERLLAADPGFNAEGLLTFRVRSPPENKPTRADTTRFQDGVERALLGIPGVTGATATSTLPLSGIAPPNQIQIPGAPGNTGDPDRDRPMVDMIGTRASYVSVMGMRVIRGRAFDPLRREGFREALIDRRLAAQFFPGGADPIGAIIPRRFMNADMPLTIVGVVDQARLYDIHEDGRGQVFVRTEDWGYRPLSFVVKTTRDPESIVQEVRAAVRSVDARVAVGEVRTMEEIVRNVLRQQQTSTVLIATFALGALLLAAMGLFGVVSGSVTRRRHELAVRLALGADHGRVVRLVIGEGALLVAIGVLIGVPGIYAVGGVLRGVLIGVSPFDPPTLAAVVAGLAAVTLFACYLPARRVLGIDPAQALRNE
jgi:putative ABC transport system permease protein